MPFSNTLSFNNSSDIVFQPAGNELRVYVKGALLGAINAAYPVTMYTTVSNGVKSITMTQITNSVYCSGNTNNPNFDTVYYNFNQSGHLPSVSCCGSNNALYKTIGWDNDGTSQTCVGTTGYTNVFDISANLSFKTKIEQVIINNQPQLRMVVRYSGGVYQCVNASVAICYATPYCYYCDPTNNAS